MSLINDALRRANQAKKKQPPDSGGEPMRPTEATTKSNPLLVPVLLILLLVVVISFAGWFFWRGLRETSVAKNAADTPQEIIPDLSPKDPRGQEKMTPAFPATGTNVIEDSIVPAEEAAINQDTVTNFPAVDPTPMPPPLKLQGIFFRPSNPTVLINGKTLAVGETIFGARVLKISRQEVTLERDGETIVLSLD